MLIHRKFSSTKILFACYMWIVFVMDCISHIYLILRSRLHKISFGEQLFGKTKFCSIFGIQDMFFFPCFTIPGLQIICWTSNRHHIVLPTMLESLKADLERSCMDLFTQPWFENQTRQPQYAMRTHYYRCWFWILLFLQILTWPESRNPTGLNQDPNDPWLLSTGERFLLNIGTVLIYR